MSVENKVRAVTQGGYGMHVSWILAVLFTSMATAAPSPRWGVLNDRCPSDGVVTVKHLRFHARNATIDLSHCGLTNIQEGSFDDMSELKHLILSHNNLRNIPKHVFIFNPSLILVDISNNPLLSMRENDSFLTSRSITELLLANCDIKSVSPETFQNLPNLVKVDLEGNPVCDTIQCNQFLNRMDAGDNKIVRHNELHSSVDNISPVLRRRSRRVLSSIDDVVQATGNTSEVRLRHISNFVSILLLTAVSVIVVFGYVIMHSANGDKRAVKGRFQEVISDDDMVCVEVVTPIKERDSGIHRRETWRQRLHVAYLITIHAAEFGMCAVKL